VFARQGRHLSRRTAESITRRGLIPNLHVRPTLYAEGKETGMFDVPSGADTGVTTITSRISMGAETGFEWLGGHRLREISGAGA
jgi:hypothetical protein